jgi:hypothetical protein
MPTGRRHCKVGSAPPAHPFQTSFLTRSARWWSRSGHFRRATIANSNVNLPATVCESRISHGRPGRAGPRHNVPGRGQLLGNWWHGLWLWHGLEPVCGSGPVVEKQPVSGRVGAAVEILGTDLMGATNVTFTAPRYPLRREPEGRPFLRPPEKIFRRHYSFRSPFPPLRVRTTKG